MRRRWAVKAMVAVLCFATPLSAQAQTARNEALAEALFRDGRALLDAKRVHEACEKFAASYEIDNAIGTLLNLAVCHEQEGKTASAWLEFSNVASMAAASSAASRARDRMREKLAREHIKALEHKLLYLTIEISQRSEGMELRLDSGVIPETAWRTPIPVDPGEHELSLSAPGKKPWKQTVVIDKSRRQQKVVIPALVDGPPAVKTLAVGNGSPQSEAFSMEPGVRTPARTHIKEKKIAAIALAGAAVVLGGVAIAEQIRLGNLKSDIDKLNQPNTGSIAAGNQSRYFELNASAKRTANWRTATAIGAGATALGSGFFFWIGFGPFGKSSASQNQGASLMVSGTF